MVFFTDVDWVDTDDALIKTGRRIRDEAYEANFEIWMFSQGEVTGGGDAIDAAFAIYDACEGEVVKASSPIRGVAGVINVVCQPVRLEPVKFDKGWAVVITARLSVTARLN